MVLVPAGRWVLVGPVSDLPRPEHDNILSIWGWNAETGQYFEVMPGDILRTNLGYWILTDATLTLRLRAD